MPKLYSKVSKSTKLIFKIPKQIKLKYKNKGNKINLYTYSGSARLKKKRKKRNEVNEPAK